MSQEQKPKEMNVVQRCAFFINQLIMTYSTVGAETKRGIQVRKIVDTYLSKQFVESTNPDVITKEMNQAIFDNYKKKQMESLKDA